MRKKAYPGLFNVRISRAVIGRVKSNRGWMANLLSDDEIMQDRIQAGASSTLNIAVGVKPFRAADRPGNVFDACPVGIDRPTGGTKSEECDRRRSIEPDRAKIRLEKAALKIVARLDAQLPAC